MKNWDGDCHRCGTKTGIHMMSMFNTQLICMGCKDEEGQHDDYDRAVEAELSQCQGGNYNFKGIGLK